MSEQIERITRAIEGHSDHLVDNMTLLKKFIAAQQAAHQDFIKGQQSEQHDFLNAQRKASDDSQKSALSATWAAAIAAIFAAIAAGLQAYAALYPQNNPMGEKLLVPVKSAIGPSHSLNKR